MLEDILILLLVTAQEQQRKHNFPLRLTGFPYFFGFGNEYHPR